MNIETGTKTFLELAQWIAAQPPDFQNLRIFLGDAEEGDQPWHGVIVAYEQQRREISEGRYEIREAYGVLSDFWTEAEYAVQRAKFEEDEMTRRRRHWERPEVREAQEKGLLP